MSAVAAGGELSRSKRYLTDLVVNTVLASHVVPRPLRRALLRACGYRVARDACVSAKTYVGSRRVMFGARSFANVGCTFDGNAVIDIREDVQIGMHVRVLTASHEIGPSTARAGTPSAAPIRIESGVWIGASSTILGGVTIGHGAIIAAGSLVRQDCKPDTLYGGVPAREIRQLY